MIDAGEVLKNLRLPTQDEIEVQRIGQEVVARLRDQSFDGTTVSIEIPCGDGEEQHRRSQRIVFAVKRRFEMQRWAVYLEPFIVDALGRPKIHRLSFMLDAAALRQGGAAAPTNGNGHAQVSLRSLAEELSLLYGGAQATPRPLPAEVDISVIFGTFDRLEVLKRAVASVRSCVGDLTYEIVVTDGGSTDGSRAWLAAQPDVVLVGERRLEGAVHAFNQAYALSRGRYVANFNDDAVYLNGALQVAVKHLETHPEAGQVALKFHDKVQGKEVVNDVFDPKTFPEVTWPTTCANFGVVRRGVAEKISHIQGGFWNPCYRTYGADCEFSAWIHRLGLKVAKLDDRLYVDDLRTEDALRKTNDRALREDTWALNRRWPAAAWKPDGPEPAATEAELAKLRAKVTPQIIEENLIVEKADGTKVWANPEKHAAAVAVAEASACAFPMPDEEPRLRRIARAIWPLDASGSPPHVADLTKERILHVALATKEDPQAGLTRALVDWSIYDPTLKASVVKQLTGGEVGRAECYAQVNWLEFPDPLVRQQKVLDAAAMIKPTLVLMQLQEPDAISPETVRTLRQLSDRRCVVAGWCGDIAGPNAIWDLGWQVPLARTFDLWLHSSYSHVRVLRALGVHCAAYLQIGYDDLQYRPPLVAPPNRNNTAEKMDGGDLLAVAYSGEPLITAADVEAMTYGDCRAAGRSYDVAFLGTRYADDHPLLARIKRHDGKLRDEVVARLKEAHGWRFALHGAGWDRARPIALDRAHVAYQRAKVGLCVSLQSDLDRYNSDRLHRVLGCGALALVKHFPGMETWGLRHGENCLAWDTASEAAEMAKFGVTAEADPIREAGARLARESLTWSARTLEMCTYVEAMREAR